MLPRPTDDTFPQSGQDYREDLLRGWLSGKKL